MGFLVRYDQRIVVEAISLGSAIKKANEFISSEELLSFSKILKTGLATQYVFDVNKITFKPLRKES